MTTTHPPSCVEDFVYGYIYVQVHVRDLLILAKDLPTLISNGTSRQLLKCVNSCDPDQCQQISDTDDLPSHSGLVQDIQTTNVCIQGPTVLTAVVIDQLFAQLSNIAR